MPQLWVWTDEEALLDDFPVVEEEAATLETEELAVEAKDDVDGEDVSSDNPVEAGLMPPPSLTQLTVINGKARIVRTLKNFFMKNIPFLRGNQNDSSLIIIKMFLASFIVHDLKININCSLFNEEKRPYGLISL